MFRVPCVTGMLYIAAMATIGVASVSKLPNRSSVRTCDAHKAQRLKPAARASASDCADVLAAQLIIRSI